MIEDAILTALKELNQASQTGNGEGVLAATRELDRLKVEAHGKVDAHLLHFLENRSYQKAVKFLETGERQKHGQ